MSVGNVVVLLRLGGSVFAVTRTAGGGVRVRRLAAIRGRPKTPDQTAALLLLRRKD